MDKTVGTIIILLDQSVGELRMEGGQVIGLDLWPNTHLQIDRLVKKGHSAILVIPQQLAAKDLTKIKEDFSFMTVLAESSLETLLKRHEFSSTASKTLIISSDRTNRQIAIQQLKFDVVPHLAAAEWTLEGKRLSFAKIFSRRRPDAKTVGLLPYYVEKREDDWLILGLVTDSALLRMFQAGAAVGLLPFDYRTGDCGFLRFDSPWDVREQHWKGASVLASDKNRLLLAFYGSALESAAAPPSAHGALEMLMPSPELLDPAEDVAGFTRRAIGLASSLSEYRPELLKSRVAPVTLPQLMFALPDVATFRSDAERYSGQVPLGTSGPIVSRHIKHPDNSRAVNELVSQLSALGYCAYTHSFVYNGQTLYSVIADLPGKGYLQIDPEILKKLLEILRKYPHPWPWPKIEKELKQELGEKIIVELKRNVGGPLRLNLEEVVGVYRWLPWWKLQDYQAGVGAQIVIVGCHLDSSAEKTPGGYNPAVDPAPGMDDNASGIAACLAAARYLTTFKGQLIHTVRFCFFNAEEAGLVGSKAYAASLKSVKAPVKAVICTDMIGYNSDANNIFEIHAGYTDPVIRDLNLPVASVIETWASSLGALQPAQIYKGTSPTVGAPDRSLYDPAINRSDHAAFHQQGYPAVAITEDYFANLPTEPGKDPNPNYHSANDRVIDADYGVSIASTVACAVKELADK